jgi:hypothetical protein
MAWLSFVQSDGLGILDAVTGRRRVSDGWIVYGGLEFLLQRSCDGGGCCIIIPSASAS